MIKVNELMLDGYENAYKNAAEALGKLLEYHSELDGILASGNWSGNHHDRCVDVVEGTNSYLTTLKTDFDSLRDVVVELVDNTDSFVKESAAVQKIQE